MKPTPQINSTDTQRGSFAPRRKGFASPSIDCNFQPTAPDFSGRCRGQGAPSFRGISRDYFEREARGHFTAEALVFGVIVISAAVPVIECIRGLFQLVYGVL
jgi:hypothetical protein